MGRLYMYCIVCDRWFFSGLTADDQVLKAIDFHSVEHKCSCGHAVGYAHSHYVDEATMRFENDGRPVPVPPEYRLGMIWKGLMCKKCGYFGVDFCKKHRVPVSREFRCVDWEPRAGVVTVE